VSHRRTVALQRANRPLGQAGSTDTATVRECWCKRARAECGRLNPRWAMAWTGSRLRCCDLYPELLHIYQSQGLQLPCHAMPCSARLGSACDTISFSLDLPGVLDSTYRPAGFGLGAQFGEDRGYISLFSVHDSRATTINQGGIQGDRCEEYDEGMKG
jgi:hypothetical protein